MTHTCALLVDGRVKCWGRNLFGQLGVGDVESRGDRPGQMGRRLRAVNLGTGRTAKQITAGLDHTCALLDDGTVKCWGAGYASQLGQGSRENVGDRPGQMGNRLRAIDLGTGRTAVQIDAGFYHTCARLDDGTVKCWGRNNEGALGLGDTRDRGGDRGQMGDRLPAVDLGTRAAVARISAGGTHTCALFADGRVKCWGDNHFGELGLGDRNGRGDEPGQMGIGLPAIDLGEGRIATQISAGNGFTCALLDGGDVKCWGNNSNGELGLGDTENRGDDRGEMGNRLPEVDLGIRRIAVQVSAGPGHVCALLDRGDVKCWGANAFGELGLGDNRRRGDDRGEMGNRLPEVDLGAGNTAAQIAADELHNCVVFTNSRLKCWGSNSGGELGLGDTDDRGDNPGEMGGRLRYVTVF